MGTEFVYNHKTPSVEYGEVDGKITFRADMKSLKVPYMVVVIRFEKLDKLEEKAA